MTRHLILAVPLVAVLAVPAAAQTSFLGKPVSRWLEELNDPKPEVRRGAAFALGKSGSGAALAALAGALGDRDATVRDAAAYALGEVAAAGDADAVWTQAKAELLRMLEGDDSPRARRSAAFAAGSCGPAAAEARGALVRALADPEAMVRQNAAWALGRLGGEGNADAVGALVRVLADDDAAVRRDAAAALGAIGPPAAAPAARPLLTCFRREQEPGVRKVVLESLVKLASPGDKELAEGLSDLLRKSDKEVARGLALALGKVGGPEAKAAVPVLSEALHDGDATVRELAAAALGNIGAEAVAAVRDLSDSLADPSVAVRRNAAVALGRIGPKAAPAVRALVRALDPKEPPEVRYYAATALGKVGAAVEEVAEDLLRYLKSDEHPLVRQRMVYALFYVREPELLRRVCDALEANLGETDRRFVMVRYDSARALAFLRGPDAPPKTVEVLLAMIKDTEIFHNLGPDATLQTGDEARSGRTDVKDRRGGDARFMAAEALGALGRKANRPEVIAALEETAKAVDEKTREESRKALEAIRGKPM